MEHDGATFDLLTRWHTGDAEALGILVARDLEWIRAFVHKRLGSTPARKFGDTEDFVQEACMRALKDGPRFVLGDRNQFRTLLATIALNVIRSQHRSAHTQKRAAAKEQALGTESVLMLDQPQSTHPAPDEQAALAEQQEWLRLAVLLLHPNDQQVIELHWLGKSDAEIGAALGVLGGAVRMRRHRAVARLTKIVLDTKAGKLAEVLAEAAAADE